MSKSKSTGQSIASRIKDDEYWAAIKDADKAHITSEGESICGIVFPRNVQKKSKQEGGLGPRRNPSDRKPWKRWDGLEKIGVGYELCGMCLNVRLGKNPEEETVSDIAEDVREIVGLAGDGATFTKSELRHLREWVSDATESNSKEDKNVDR